VFLTFNQYGHRETSVPAYCSSNLSLYRNFTNNVNRHWSQTETKVFRVFYFSKCINVTSLRTSSNSTSLKIQTHAKNRNSIDFSLRRQTSWRWCRLVFDFYILDGSYVTLLPWPVFPLICLRSDLIAWKIRFPVLSITASLHIIHPYADVQIDRVLQTLI